MHETGSCASRKTRPLCADSPQGRIREFEHGFVYKRCAKAERSDPLWTTGRVPVAERIFPGRALRVARSPWMTRTCSRDLVVHPGAEGSRALRAEAHPGVTQSDQGFCRPLGSPSHVVNQTSRLGRPGRNRRPREREPRRERPRRVSMLRKTIVQDIDAIADATTRRPDPRSRAQRAWKCPTSAESLYHRGMTLAQYREPPVWKNLLNDFRWHMVSRRTCGRDSARRWVSE